MWCPFLCGQDNLLRGQFWAVGKLNLLDGQMPTQLKPVTYFPVPRYWTRKSMKFQKYHVWNQKESNVFYNVHDGGKCLKFLRSANGMKKSIEFQCPLHTFCARSWWKGLKFQRIGIKKNVWNSKNIQQESVKSVYISRNRIEKKDRIPRTFLKYQKSNESVKSVNCISKNKIGKV